MLRRSEYHGKNSPRTIPRGWGNIPTTRPGGLQEAANPCGFPTAARGIPVALRAGMMTMESVQGVLGRLRPLLEAEGGDIQVVHVGGGCVEVRLTLFTTEARDGQAVAPVSLDERVREF